MLGRFLQLAGDDDAGPTVDLTPMIDVTFLLVIFWMAVTSLSPSQPVRELELPAAAVTRSAGQGRPIIIDITYDKGSPLYMEGVSYSPLAMEAHLANHPLAGREVVLRADRRASAELVARVARLCHRHGAASVAFSLRTGGG